MRFITRGLLALAVVLGPAVGSAQAITIKEIIQFKNLGAPILISLIEADDSVFHLTAQEVSDLKDQGVPEPVILAMIDTAKPKAERKIVGVPVPGTPSPAPPEPTAEPPDAAAASDSAPAPVVVDANQTPPVMQQVAAPPEVVEIPVPVAVPVIEHARRPLPEPQKTPIPQYWGYGGQKRPDSWGPTPAPPAQHADAKPDPAKKGGGR